MYECLDVGKTSEEDRQHLDFIVVKKFHLNSQHPDAADHVFWAHLSPGLDDGVANVQFMHSRHQESKEAQVWVHGQS